MDNSTLRVVLASAGISFALGFGMAWTMKPAAPEAAAVAVAQAAPPALRPAPLDPFAVTGGRPAPAAPVLDQAGVDELWARALAPQDPRAPGYDAEDRLRKLVQSDPVALRSLLQRYDGAPTPQARELLKSVLSTIQKPDVIAFSTRLANSSNAAERKYGFELLQGLAPESPEIRAIVQRTLATEQSPEVLVQALGTLQSGAAGPEESERVVAQLKILAQHADAAVRSQSIMQLGQWDRTGEGMERLTQALGDRAPEVRQAAIFAIAQTGAKSEPVKAALMGLINNAQESKDVRGSALQVLERFSLSKEEYASVHQLRTQMQKM